MEGKVGQGKDEYLSVENGQEGNEHKEPPKHHLQKSREVQAIWEQSILHKQQKF